MSGLIADARTLVEHARVETQVPFVIMLMILMYICFTFFFFLRQMLYFTLLCGVEILISKCTFNRIIGFHMGSQWLLSPLHKLFVTLPCDLVKGMKNPWLWMLYLSNTISYCHFFVWGSSEIFDTIIYFASMFASDDYNIVQNNL